MLQSTHKLGVIELEVWHTDLKRLLEVANMSDKLIWINVVLANFPQITDIPVKFGL